MVSHFNILVFNVNTIVCLFMYFMKLKQFSIKLCTPFYINRQHLLLQLAEKRNANKIHFKIDGGVSHGRYLKGTVNCFPAFDSASVRGRGRQCL